MDKTVKKEIALRGAVAAIPYLGGTINSIWADISAERKMARFEQFLMELESKVEAHKDSVNESFVKKDDFLDLFENTARHLMIERSSVKRKMYKDILLSSILDNNADYDKTEKFILLLERMTHNEILILKAFFNPQKINEDYGQPIKDLNTYESPFSNWGEYSVIDLLQILFTNINSDEITDSVYFLINNRLINLKNEGHDKRKTNGNPLNFLENIISAKGKEFMLYLNS